MPAIVHHARDPRSHRWNTPAIAAALLLHGGLVVALWGAWHAATEAPAPFGAVTLRLVREEPVAQPAPEAPRLVAPSSVSPPAVRRKAVTRPSTDSVSREAVTSTPAADESSQTAATPATAADPKLPAIDPDSIARAARLAAQGTTLARQSDQLLGKIEPPTAQERLAAGVARGARRDCLKGDMDGNSGYQPRIGGLFEIPFLAYDAITGKCRR